MDMTNVDKAVASMIERAVNGVDAAVAFGAAQLPDIIRQLLVWKTTQYIFLVLLYAGIVLVSVFIARRKFNNCNCDLDGLVFLFMVASASIFGVLCVSSICDLLQIALAPKVWLLEYARDLLK